MSFNAHKNLAESLYNTTHLITQAGGCKAGTFDPYPKHAEEPYQNPKVIRTPDKTKGGVFKPSPCPKSMPTRSVVQQNVMR